MIEDMGQATLHPPVLLVLAAVSRYEQALHWGAEQAVAAWGPIADRSEVFQFTETNYYESTMGSGLRKQFFTFTHPIAPERLVDVKLQTNLWEEEYARAASHPEPRPLNLDPGYLTAAKLVLASTKDHAHRIYLDRGIYAEVTLYYRGGRWQPREWTYPDYRRDDFQAFFSRVRDDWQRRAREGRG